MRLITSLLLLVLAASPSLAQGQDPRVEFTTALGRVTAALDGRFGDDRSRVMAGLSALERALAAWDDNIGRVEASVADERAKSSSQNATRLHVAMALTLAERGRVDDALKQLDAALSLSPRDVDAHTVLGLVHSQLTSNAAAATSAFRAAVASDPTAPLQRYLLAKQLADQGSLEEAAAVGLALRTDARSPDAPDRAPFLRISLIPEVPNIEPYFPHGRYAAAFALLARGQYEAAVTALKVAAAADPLVSPPEAAKPDLTLADTALRDGDTATALAALDRVREGAPTWSEVHRLRGVVLVAEERVADGVAAFREAVRLTPTDERAHLALADAFTKEERYDEAEAALRAAIAEVPQSPRLHHARARVLQRQGLYPEALTELDRALSLQSSLPLLGMNSVYESIGTLRRARQELAEATTAFSRRVNLVPNDVTAHRDLGDIFFRQGLDELAWTEFAIAEAIAPRDMATQAALAQLHLRAGRNAEAIAAARRMIQLDSTHAQAHFVLGTALMRMDQADEGTRELDSFARLQASEAATQKLQLELAGFRREAEVSTREGDHAKAVAFLNQAVRKDPTSAGAHMALGAALLRAGRAAEAVDRLQHAAGLGAYGEVYRYLADAYGALGQADQSARAREAYARIRRESLRQAGRQ